MGSRIQWRVARRGWETRGTWGAVFKREMEGGSLAQGGVVGMQSSGQNLDML